VDQSGVTDAAERLAKLDGIEFVDALDEAADAADDDADASDISGDLPGGSEAPDTGDVGNALDRDEVEVEGEGYFAEGSGEDYYEDDEEEDEEEGYGPSAGAAEH
jgi:hypothetical protein